MDRCCRDHVAAGYCRELAHHNGRFALDGKNGISNCHQVSVGDPFTRISHLLYPCDDLFCLALIGSVFHLVERCGNCHDAHGSNHMKLLNAKEPFLCQRCHSDARHPGTLYDQLNINSNRLFDRSCGSCHIMVHGSNHPSGIFLLR